MSIVGDSRFVSYLNSQNGNEKTMIFSGFSNYIAE